MDTSQLDKFIATYGRPLPCGEERALSRDDALAAVALARESGAPILGGDVYLLRIGVLAPGYANWYANQAHEEGNDAFACRSCDEAEAYMRAFPKQIDSEPFFVLVRRNH